MYYDQIKLLKQGVEKARGLLGDAIDVVPGLGTVNQGLLAAENIGRGNLAGAAENIQNLVPTGKIAGRAIKALTKGKGQSELGGLLNIDAPKYQGSHRAPYKDDEGFNAPLSALDKLYPSDVYGPKAIQYYGAGQPGEREALRVAAQVRNNPSAKVKMYRAVPKDVDAADINPGDWVTLSKDYAKYHGDAVLGGDYKILSKEVPAGSLYTNADSLNEFGYDPTGFGIQGGLLGSATDSSMMNRYQAPQDEALALAQKRAALPVSEGGLGLPPDNTPMQRADILFPKKGFHATGSDIRNIDPARVAESDYGTIGQGFYIDPSPNAGYSNLVARINQAKAPQNIMPVRYRDDNLFDMTGMLGPDSPSASKSLTERLSDMGYQGAMSSVDGLPNEVAVFDPKIVRSEFAAFDPFRRNEADLLAIQGGLLGTSQDSSILNRYETDADRRMEIARRNAALPVDQGGLGLPADNTPQMRAKAMGYTEEAFIGRDGDYEAYDVTKAVGKTAGTGAWSSSNPAVASTYALGKEANVMPVLVRQGNSLSVDAKGKNWNRLDAKTKVKAPAMVVEDKDAAKLPQLNLLEDAPPLKRVKAINSSLGKMFPDEVKYDDFSTDDLARFGRNQQYDSARFDNVVDVGASGRYMTDQAKNPSTNFVSYNPADLRSRFAAFDPMRRGEADLLALQGGQYTPQDLLGFERMMGLLGE